MSIRQLPADLINRIAAGEVVERPASVVKELVENAIDAGAQRVTITTAGGGKTLIRIEADGGGMDRDDLVLSVERHATSKLQDDGLDDIRTLGFRGEALASIGAVSHLGIASRPDGAASGLRLVVDRGSKSGPLPHPMNRGTIVEVGDLFAAYADYTFRDRFPAIALYLSIDPAEVDVNVHPAKAELRFRDGGAVRGAVIRAITGALEAAGHRASSTVADDVLAALQAPEPTRWPSGFTEPPASYEIRPGAAAALPGFSEPSARFEPAPPALAAFEEFPLGAARAQLFENFIVAQNGSSLVLVDQHAAHERLVYERFKAELAAGPVASQAMLIPAVIELPEEDCERIEAAAAALEQVGLYLERFGPRAVAVRETPALLGQTDIEPLIRDIADGLAEWDSVAALGDRLDAIIGRMACHGSVRSGRHLRVDEMNALLRQMESTPHSGQCNHGRPTYVELKKSDLERLFGRTR